MICDEKKNSKDIKEKPFDIHKKKSNKIKLKPKFVFIKKKKQKQKPIEKENSKFRTKGKDSERDDLP